MQIISNLSLSKMNFHSKCEAMKDICRGKAVYVDETERGEEGVKKPFQVSLYSLGQEKPRIDLKA